MNHLPGKSHFIQSLVVSAQQMQAIESCLFANGMPVAALMEKVGGLIARRIQTLYPLSAFPVVGVLAGPGHNGADALVVARELSFQGYDVRVYHPFAKTKELTAAHAQFARSLSIPCSSNLADLQSCHLLIDGLFGFGLERPIEGEIAAAIHEVNQWSIPIVSIDIPSGLHTDTGEVLGISIRATQTLCLGLWKLGLVQDQALKWSGQAELLDFDIPWSAIQSVLGDPVPIQRLLPSHMLPQLRRKRDRTTHKYQQGHLFLIGGSHKYAGSVILAGLGARASGVGMLTIAVPASLKSMVVARLPDAVVMGCAETDQGAIAQLPQDLDLERFDTIAYGPGVTTESGVVLEGLLECDRPLLLDADGLNLLANLGPEQLQHRSALSVLTPHAGEFQRLFPQMEGATPIVATQQAAQMCNAFIVRKGACTTIAAPNGQIWVNTESTPALARGGSGDVLTGLMGGLMAQAARQEQSLESAIQGAVWWHAQTGCWAAQRYTEMGVNAEVLAESLIAALTDSVWSE